MQSLKNKGRNYGDIAWKLEYCISAKFQASSRVINPEVRL